MSNKRNFFQGLLGVVIGATIALLSLAPKFWGDTWWQMGVFLVLGIFSGLFITDWRLTIKSIKEAAVQSIGFFAKKMKKKTTPKQKPAFVFSFKDASYLAKEALLAFLGVAAKIILALVCFAVRVSFGILLLGLCALVDKYSTSGLNQIQTSVELFSLLKIAHTIGAHFSMFLILPALLGLVYPYFSKDSKWAKEFEGLKYGLGFEKKMFMKNFKLFFFIPWYLVHVATAIVICVFMAVVSILFAVWKLFGSIYQESKLGTVAISIFIAFLAGVVAIFIPGFSWQMSVISGVLIGALAYSLAYLSEIVFEKGKIDVLDPFVIGFKFTRDKMHWPVA
jgi:hypothetical protein